VDCSLFRLLGLAGRALRHGGIRAVPNDPSGARPSLTSTPDIFVAFGHYIPLTTAGLQVPVYSTQRPRRPGAGGLCAPNHPGPAWATRYFRGMLCCACCWAWVACSLCLDLPGWTSGAREVADRGRQAVSKAITSRCGDQRPAHSKGLRASGHGCSDRITMIAFGGIADKISSFLAPTRTRQLSAFGH